MENFTTIYILEVFLLDNKIIELTFSEDLNEIKSFIKEPEKMEKLLSEHAIKKEQVEKFLIRDNRFPNMYKNIINRRKIWK